jgi:hypothetical protein
MMMNRELSVNAGVLLSGASQAQYAGAGVGVRSSPTVSAGDGQRDFSGGDDVKVSLTKSAEIFSAEVKKKDDLAEIAVLGRSARGGLEKADAVLNEISAQVAVVKNYPPFPPGNEERAKYLNSLDGLKKQLQSLVVPPVSPEYEPIFYPREDVFPPLDAKVPSDAAVLAFGDVVLAIKGDLNTAKAALEAQLAKVTENAGYVRAVGETGAREISKTIAEQIQGNPQPLSAGSDVYAHI